MKKLVVASFAAAMMAFGGITLAAPSNAAQSSPMTGQIMVKFRDDGAAVGVLGLQGLSDGPGSGSTGAHVVKVPAGTELQFADALSRNPAVEYAEPDQPATAAAADDPYFPRQYALQNEGQSFNNTANTLTVAPGKADADVDAVEAWSVTTGKGIKVAVLDSGVATDNDDINPQVVARANFSNAKTNEDKYGHGTHVAGIIAAVANNTEGVAGVCPDCKILAGKVLNDSGAGFTSDLVDGINWAVGAGAKVINMSLAVRASRTLETAVNNAWKKGVVLVAAAGNTGSQTMMYPGAYQNVIAVGATDNTDAKASFSTFGPWVDVAAPGVSVYSTFPNHDFVLATQSGRSQGYDIGSGTSMATPVVAATAALVWSKDPAAANSAVRAKVESTTDAIDGVGTYWAHGRVNANNAVR
ncbi:thermitase [Arthrobacter sp. B3I9]|uniref:S8 family serine peptidase n=1 Tax=Arthrobacter sp. B3I9 TaxID=3042270 RepID=UPI00278EB91B|nr:S8 family serine peptidase [Arthrobacter sp. B3I9]MDQ0851285.1 thermitase [Arthrobacter sp. B3I9]